MGDDTDMIPVRDHSRRPYEQGGFNARVAVQRPMVAKFSRDELEDKFLRLYEESIIQKKYLSEQKDKIKRMATKLLRLMSDKKKQTDGGGKMRDIEMEEMLEEMHAKVRDHEKQNSVLKEKLMLAKQQLQVPTKRNTYGYVSARINTGIPRTPVDPRIAKSVRVSGPVPVSGRQGTQPRFGHSLLEETRAENRQLEGVIEQLNDNLNLYDQDMELLKERMRVREAEYEEDLLKLKQQMSAGQRTTIQENIDVIKLQREVKEKSARLTQLQGQFEILEEKLRTVRMSHDTVLDEMEKVNEQLRSEQAKMQQAKTELEGNTRNNRKFGELKEQLNDMERECQILRDANEKLVSSAFDMEREREWRKRENALKVQVAQLEATLRSDVGEKGSILDKLSEERSAHENLSDEHRELRIKFFEMKQEHDNVKEKMKFFTKDSAVDFTEIEEALMLIKSRKAKEDQNLEFLVKVDEEKVKDQGKLINELQAEHADTIHELEKTRNMLIVQHNINKDYQMEVTVVSKKMDDNKAEYESKLEEYAQLLDIRAARIKKLEKQLRDVAYGTKQYKLQATDVEAGSDEEPLDETVKLERGQNLFEIHIKRVVLSPEGLEQLGDAEPSVFVTWDFYEYEIQATPVMKGPRSEFQFTSQYLVKVDDFFIHYIQKDSTTLELHQSVGTDYKTVAACQLKMRDLLDQSSGRIYQTVQLTGVGDGGLGVHYGTVEYWVRLRVPMAQALRLYKERAKALGYLQSNQTVAQQALEAMDDDVAKRPPDNVNELHIKVVRCDSLKPRQEDVQPSAFAMYKFFDFMDHDTSIVLGSNNPQFNDHKTFPVPMTFDVDKYLKSCSLLVYIFDDMDPNESSYIGLAKIPLLSLAHDKPIKGIFELQQKDGSVTGTVTMHMKWSYTYLPPTASTRTQAQAQQLLHEAREDPQRLVMLRGEQEAMEESSILAAAPGPMAPVPRKARATSLVDKVPGAAATSTPVHTRQPEAPRPLTRMFRKLPANQGPLVIPKVNIIPDSPLVIKDLAPLPIRDLARLPINQYEDEDEMDPSQSDTQDIPPAAGQERGTMSDELSEISEGTHVTGESDAITDLDEAELTGPLAEPLPIDVSIQGPRVNGIDPVVYTAGGGLHTQLSSSLEEDDDDDDEPPVIERKGLATLSSTFDQDESEVVTEGIGESTEYSESQMEATAASEELATNEMGTLEETGESENGSTWSPKPLPRRGAARNMKTMRDDDDHIGEPYSVQPVLPQTDTSYDDTTEMTETQLTENDRLGPIDNDFQRKRTVETNSKNANDLEDYEEEEESEEEVKTKSRFSLFSRNKDKAKEKKEKEKKEKEKKEREKKEKEMKAKDKNKGKKVAEDEEQEDEDDIKNKSKKKDKTDKRKDKSDKAKGKNKVIDISEDRMEDDEDENQANTKDKKAKGKDKAKNKRDNSKDRGKSNEEAEEDDKSSKSKGKDKKDKTKDKRDKSKDRTKNSTEKDEEDDEGEGKKTKSRFSLFGSKDKKAKEKKGKKKKDEEPSEDTITGFDDDPAQSTMFGDKPDSDEEPSIVTSQRLESEDSDIIMCKRDSRPGSRNSHPADNSVTITIGKVTINEGASILKRADIQMLFVEYRFLNVPLEQTETPFSLPKPKAGQTITFNFTKVVPIDFEANYERRQFLASMLLPKDPEQGRVKFTIVSEPASENDDADCEDVGVAYVSLPDILKNGRDIKDEEIPVHDVNNPKKVIGGIQLSFECLSALRAVKEEMET